MKKLMLALCSILIASFTAAASMSPEGTWRTIDDETGDPRSIVKIWVEILHELLEHVHLVVAERVAKILPKQCVAHRSYS